MINGFWLFLMFVITFGLGALVAKTLTKGQITHAWAIFILWLAMTSALCYRFDGATLS